MGLLWPPATNPSNVFLPQPSTRPADWPSMPAPAANTIRILAAVWNATGTNGNYCALNVSVSSGTYTVDWGDGTAPQTYTSGSKADYQYSYASSGLAPLTAEGYKTALVTITPTTGGQTITALNLNVLNSSSKNGVPNPWLDLQIHATSLTSLVVSGGSGKSTFLNACNIYSLGSVTNLSYCFSYCYSLQTVTFPSGSLASVTNLSGCFNSCYSLSSIVNAAFPITFDVSNCALTNTAIDAIFTALPTVSGQTATVTGNPGAATCTPSIATGKGWTVVQ